MDSARGRAYQARPGCPAVVAADLADLHGPGTATVELPLRLFWSLPGHRFDLGDGDRLWSGLAPGAMARRGQLLLP